MGLTNSKPPDPKMGSKNVKPEMRAAEKIPSVYVNYDLLNFDTPHLRSQRGQKVYEIDGESYTENLDVNDNFEEFKLYAGRIGVRDTEIETPILNQKYEVESVKEGYILNSSIFLNERQYHTIKNVFEDLLNCFVCDDIVLDENYESHIDNEEHKRNLVQCTLEKHHIMRVKNYLYHCGVCDDVFHKTIFPNHLECKSHGNNVTIASKKAAEILMERNKNNDNKNRNNENKNNDNVIEIVGNNDNSVNVSLECKVSVNTEKNVFVISPLTWHMISLGNKDNNFYCMACKLKDSVDNLRLHVNDEWHNYHLKTFKINEQYEKHLIRQNSSWCHCSTCNTVHYLGGTDLHVMKHDKGKTCQILSTPNTSADIKNKGNHPESPNASRDIENRTKNKNNDSQSSNPFIGPDLLKMNNENNYNDIVKAIINEQCFVFLFGYRIKVSMLSLNVIFYSQHGYFYCGLCKIKFLAQYLQSHIKSVVHYSLLNSTMAVQQYGFNYIRSIDNKPHCGICHMLIQPSMLLIHLHDPQHLLQMNIALCFTNLPPPPPVAKIIPTIKIDNQNPKIFTPNKNEVNVIDSKMESSKNKTEEIKNGINDSKTSDDMKNVINENAKINKEDIYIEVNKCKMQEIESKYGDDYKTGIFEAEIEVLRKKNRIIISLMSYNTLVPIGDGDSYCFACDVKVGSDLLKDHICSKNHLDKIDDNKFLEEYTNNLIRQNDYFYHCALCNTVIRRADLQNHIEWPLHVEQKNKNRTNVKKKERNSVDYQNKIFPTDNEVIYNTKITKEIIIKWSYIIKQGTDDTKNSAESLTAIDKETQRKETEIIVPKKKINLNENKTIIIDDLNIKLVLKWDAWNSIIRTKKKYMCIICNEKMNSEDIYDHINSDGHYCKLNKPFTNKYFPALIREVTAEMQHCVTCNTVLYGECNLQTHIQGNKHKKQFDDLLNNSKDDNNEDVLIV